MTYDFIAVKINPTIHMSQSRVNTTGNGATWTNGDQIKVNMVSKSTAAKKDSAVYKYTSSSWVLQGSDYMAWPANNSGEKYTFEAYYPYAEGSSSSFTNFDLPSDQSTEEKIKSADWMLATTTTSKVESVNLPFKHMLAKLTVKIVKYGHFYNNPIPTVNDPQFYVPFMATIPKGKTMYVKENASMLRGLMKEDKSAAKQHSFTILLIPGRYNEYTKFLQLNVNGQTRDVATSNNDVLTKTGFKAGKAYTFNLIMGQTDITIGDVTIEDWETGNLQGEPGGDANEFTE